eukprot:TRINITY_DN55469_c0_g1_i1.p1 TRINITY_DN55469_c0_g1~~TRINITY_DN55469_c0_g1_i1.p1  ORF type:complete len:269 (+),score=23.77 TRINITY_DN55469_c0_g1_i1:39-845(+)
MPGGRRSPAPAAPARRPRAASGTVAVQPQRRPRPKRSPITPPTAPLPGRPLAEPEQTNNAPEQSEVPRRQVVPEIPRRFEGARARPLRVSLSEDPELQLAIALSLGMQDASRGSTPDSLPPVSGGRSRATQVAANSEEWSLETEASRNYLRHLRAALVNRRRQFHDEQGNGRLGLQLQNMTYEALLQLEDVKVGVPEEILTALPSFVFNSQTSTGLKDCPICLSEYDDGDLLTVLHCVHIFHYDCLATWLREHKTCPVCKADVVEMAT